MIHRLKSVVRAIPLGLGIALSCVLAEREALAQGTPDAIPNATNGDGFDSHLFRPAMDSKGLFSVNGSDILGANEVSFGLVIDYGHNLLRTSVQGARSSSTTRSRARSSSTTASSTRSSSASTSPSI